MRQTLLALPLAIFMASPALAQEGGDFTDSSGWSAGLFTTYGASFDSSDFDISAMPFIQYQTGPWTFGGENLATYFVETDLGGSFNLEAVFGLGLDFGQSGGGAPDVDLAATSFLDLTLGFQYGQLGYEVQERLWSNQKGAVETFTLASGLPLGEAGFLAVQYSDTNGNAAYRNSFYGVNSEGDISTALSLAYISSLTPQIDLIATVSQNWLSSDLAGQSFVENDSWLDGGLLISYNF